MGAAAGPPPTELLTYHVDQSDACSARRVELRVWLSCLPEGQIQETQVGKDSERLRETNGEKYSPLSEAV